MRAPRRERSRGGGGCRAEQIAARATDAFKYALCSMHADRSANALRVVWNKGTGGRAERVVGGVAVRVGVASDRRRRRRAEYGDMPPEVSWASRCVLALRLRMAST